MQDARRDAKFLSEFSKRASEKPGLNLAQTNSNLRDLVKKRRVGSQKLTKAAALLLMTPDPITDLAAVPLLVAARMCKKTSDYEQLFEHANKVSTLLASELSYF